QQLRELTLGTPDEPAAQAKVGRQLALEPCRDFLGAGVLEVGRDRRGGAAERRNQQSFFTRLPHAVAIAVGPPVAPLPDRRIRIRRRAQLRAGVPPVPAVGALDT